MQARWRAAVGQSPGEPADIDRLIVVDASFAARRLAPEGHIKPVHQVAVRAG